MKNYKALILAAAMAAPVLAPRYVFAEEPATTTTTTETGTDPLTQEETAASDTQDRPEWKSSVQTKYSLTDEQMKQMTDAGIKGPGLAITAGLAAKSGKTVQEVALMRTEQKMGWGKIAKELGVHPGEIGKSVSSLRHEIRDGRKELRAEKQAKIEEKMAKREAKAAAKLEKREAKRAEKAGKKQ